MNNTNKYRFLLLTALLITGFLSSCLKDDNSDCPRPFQVTVKVLDADQVDITESGAVEQVMLFVFDENGQIFKTFTVTGEQVRQRKPIDIQMEYPGHKSLKFIAWANLDTKVNFAQISSVKQLSDIYVRLKSQSTTLTNALIAQSPGDLFFGALDLNVEFGGTEPGQSHTLTIKRKAASVIITGKNLPNTPNAPYSYLLRESYDTYDHNGALTGNMTNYNPPTSFNNAGHLVTPIFNIFPTTEGKSYILDVYQNGKLLYSFTKDSEGKTLTPVVGKLLNIIINFEISLSMKVVVTPWGVVHQQVEI